MNIINNQHPNIFSSYVNEIDKVCILNCDQLVPTEQDEEKESDENVRKLMKKVRM